MTKSKIAATITLCVLLVPVIAFAQVPSGMEQNAPGGPGGQISTLRQIVHDIEQTMGFIFGAIAVICFLVAGILFLTAGGQAEKIGAARSAFIWGIAGVVVGIIAFSIVAIVGSFIA